MADANTLFTQERYGNNSMTGNDYSLERVLKVLQWLPSQGKLLEIGAWDGTIIRHYSSVFKGLIYGLDLNLEIMKEAMPLLAEAKACDLNSDVIPWENQKFDCVVCNEVIEHIFDTDRLLLEIHRVLKPGGKLILSTPNLASLFNRICLLLGWQPFSTEVSSRKSNYGNPLRKSLDPAGHIRVYTPKALREQLIASGFEIVQVSATPISTSKALKFLEKVASTLSSDFGSDMIIHCQRQAQ